MNELKPFHESIFDSFDKIFKRFDSYRRPGGEFSSQPIDLLIKDLNIVIYLIKNTKIPAEKLKTFVDDINKIFCSLENNIKTKGYGAEDLERIENIRNDLLTDLINRN